MRCINATSPPPRCLSVRWRRTRWRPRSPRGLRSAQDALLTTTRMSEITVGPNPHFKIPALDFAGTPTGIDIRRVVELETEPVINTGIAHRRGGVGQIGAGVARAPLACFQQALAAFAERYAT